MEVEKGEREGTGLEVGGAGCGASGAGLGAGGAAAEGVGGCGERWAAGAAAGLSGSAGDDKSTPRAGGGVGAAPVGTASSGGG